MNPNVKQQLVDALRSGDYEQDSEGSQLRRGDRFCVLGVLCDLYPQGEWVSYPSLDLEGEYGFTVGGREYDSNSELPPREVLVWAGLAAGCEHEALMNANDEGTSFLDLADTIEKEL